MLTFLGGLFVTADQLHLCNISIQTDSHTEITNNMTIPDMEWVADSHGDNLTLATCDTVKIDF